MNRAMEGFFGFPRIVRGFLMVMTALFLFYGFRWLRGGIGRPKRRPSPGRPSRPRSYLVAASSGSGPPRRLRSGTCPRPPAAASATGSMSSAAARSGRGMPPSSSADGRRRRAATPPDRPLALGDRLRRVPCQRADGRVGPRERSPGAGLGPGRPRRLVVRARRGLSGGPISEDVPQGFSPASRMNPPPIPGSEAAKELASQGKALSQKVVQEIGKVVVGMEGVTRQLLIALLPAATCCWKACPGVAKTTLSKAFARILGCEFQRVQFTPGPAPVGRHRHLDLRPQDQRVRAAQGADLLPGAAGGRDQPGPGQDAVGPAGGDAGVSR